MSEGQVEEKNELADMRRQKERQQRGGGWTAEMRKGPFKMMI